MLIFLGIVLYLALVAVVVCVCMTAAEGDRAQIVYDGDTEEQVVLQFVA